METTCYLENRSPTSTFVDKTPQEVCTGNKPSIKHLKVFGCDAYVHVPKDERGKLDNEAEKCIFIGYKYGMKGYKLWNLVTKKIVYSRDVEFREVKELPRKEVTPMEKELEKIEFELEGEESDSIEEEPHTPVSRRSSQERRKPEGYSPPHFLSYFSFSMIDYDPRNMKEFVDS